MKIYHRPAGGQGIPIVPMLDILTILLIFFIVHTEFKHQVSVLNLDVPQTRHLAGVQGDRNSILLEVGDDGSIAFNGKVISSSQLVEEVRALLNSGVPEKCTAMQAIGYKEMAEAVLRTGDYHAGAEEIKLRSRQYAKRQLTWFKRNTAAKQIVWGSDPDLLDALRRSTEFMEEFGI